MKVVAVPQSTIMHYTVGAHFLRVVVFDIEACLYSAAHDNGFYAEIMVYHVLDGIIEMRIHAGDNGAVNGIKVDFAREHCLYIIIVFVGSLAV